MQYQKKKKKWAQKTNSWQGGDDGTEKKGTECEPSRIDRYEC